MNVPARKYNCLFLLTISIIGSFFGALAISGLIGTVMLYLYDLLPKENLGIPVEVSGLVCNVLYWGILICVPGFLLVRYAIRLRNRAKKDVRREAFDAFLDDKLHRPKK